MESFTMSRAISPTCSQDTTSTTDTMSQSDDTTNINDAVCCSVGQASSHRTQQRTQYPAIRRHRGIMTLTCCQAAH